jgi:nucleoid DNA-binding protein
MQFSALLERCSARTGLPKRVVAQVATALFDEILLILCEESSITVPRFGKIELRHKKNSKNVGYLKITQSRLVRKLFNLAKSFKKPAEIEPEGFPSHKKGENSSDSL